MVFVHVQTDRPVVLEALMPEETRWVRLCVAPCDIEVPLDAEYRVTGPGMQPSRPVDLEAAPRDRAVLDISVRTNDQHRTGDRLYVASWVMAGVGLALGAGALAVDPSSEAQPVLMWSGIGAEAAMVAMAITSHVLSQPTGISQSVSPADPRGAAPGGGSWARLPTWHDSAALGVLAPRATVVPLLSTSF
jgi:hypothetical protein